MTIASEKLSAFLDGELGPDEMSEIERALENDAALQAELETLMQADVVFKQHFDDMLGDPVPLDLAKAVEGFEAPVTANIPAAPKPRFWMVSASAVVALVVGLAGGFFLGQESAGNAPQTQIAARGWLDDIASYHRVYAAQDRHLVEVPASEATHIEAWLTSSVGTQVAIPDLSDMGLTFAGGRLLVAADKPVAQLIYTDANGAVVALCSIKTDAPVEGLNARTVGAFDMVSWGAGTANFVLIGDQGRADLPQIAQSLATEA